MKTKDHVRRTSKAIAAGVAGMLAAGAGMAEGGQFEASLTSLLTVAIAGALSWLLAYLAPANKEPGQ